MKEGLENSKVGHLSLWPRWNAELESWALVFDL